MEATAAPAPDRSRRVYVWWGVGFAFLAALGCFCLLVAGPVVEVRRAAEDLLPAPMAGYFPERASLETAVAGLGGPHQAARKIGLYLRVPERLSGDYQWTAAAILGGCGKPGLGKLRELLDDRSGVRFKYGYWGAMCFDWYYRGSSPNWSSYAVMETAAKDPDPELAGLAEEIAKLLNAQTTPGPIIFRPMSAPPPK